MRVDWEGRRQVLGVELANQESSSSWAFIHDDFLVTPKGEIVGHLGIKER
jgi:hypothetical protein